MHVHKYKLCASLRMKYWLICRFSMSKWQWIDGRIVAIFILIHIFTFGSWNTCTYSYYLYGFDFSKKMHPIKNINHIHCHKMFNIRSLNIWIKNQSPSFLSKAGNCRRLYCIFSQRQMDNSHFSINIYDNGDRHADGACRQRCCSCHQTT